MPPAAAQERQRRAPVKVAFIGTHGVGKTTLCYDLAGALKRQGVHVDMVKEVARLSPLPINRKTSLEAQTWILMTQVAEEIRSGAYHAGRGLRPQRARQLRLHDAGLRPAGRLRALRRALDEDLRPALQGARSRARPPRTACATPTSSSCARSTSSWTRCSPR